MPDTFKAGCQLLAENVAFSVKRLELSCVRYSMLELSFVAYGEDHKACAAVFTSLFFVAWVT